ncbi:hypothetical protein C5167_014866 [Papaver somniferum]|uniref:Bms1-type G domain-containing protein n=1 Tax=Papaver somniferum TaxID=3469 RepID=A0A4Y7J8S5_PAPSO|nr:ribosome biogenesis protein BMS1 homolog isoform X1 [Papaver somniferum]RZC56015.1 hypothetical protein C5167_014866 [Papaver somniferum]
MSSPNSQVDHRPAAFRIYRDFKECEDVWDDGNRTMYWGNDHEPEAPPPPPFLILVQGPPNVGKSLLIRSLVNHFTMEEDDIQGPVTIITADKRTRLQFVECPDDISAMIDAAKYADLVLLMVDASYGFEAETFEFLNLLQAHGLPKVMGVLTHLDEFEDETKLNDTKERLQDLFRTEIYQGAVTYNLSGLQHDLYNMGDVQELAEEILTLQFHLSSRRAAHPYVLVDRFKDATPLKKVHKNANCKRNICLYGYLRGCSIKSGAKVHIAGFGDFYLAGVRSTTDPFPLSPEMDKESDLVELTHMENEGFRTGTYLRLEVHGVPFKMVQNHDPCHLILVGGISFEEENNGYMQVRLKRHNWHMKLLKSGDPVTVSAGWRRYQTQPIYAREINNGQHKYLEFNPEDEHCLAMFQGPVAPPCTRIAVVQRKKDAFRIAAKAVVLEPKHHSKIMKDSKREGKPQNIYNERTALIKFEPGDIDVAALKGAPIQTRSGIWGMVNEEAEEKGIARCTFEDTICMSDTFIMRVLCQFEAPCFFKQYNSIVPVDDESLRKKRRGVEIIDGEPSSYPYSKFTLFLNIMYMCDKEKETVVVISEQKRLDMLEKHEEEELKKPVIGLPRILCYG